MESLVLLHSSSLLRPPTRSLFAPRRPSIRTHRRPRFPPPPPRCNKMFVPGFGEASPEAKAARNLQDFFTFLALKIVLAQLESYNPEAYGELMGFVERNPMKDGEDFCRRLMRESPRHKDLETVAPSKTIANSRQKSNFEDVFYDVELSHATALRILEVRSAYSKRDFEWENLRKLALKMVDESNTKLMREYIQETSHFDNGM